jgi:hypothetical protein
MIKDFFFVVRMLGLTIIVALVMQVHIGEKSIEEEFHGWLKKSIFVDYVQEAIDGGVAMTRVGYKKADTGIHALLGKLSKRHEGKKERGFNLNLKRYNEKDDGEEEDTLPLTKSQPRRTM